MTHHSRAEAGYETVNVGHELISTIKRPLGNQGAGEAQGQGELNEQLNPDEEVEKVPGGVVMVIRVGHGGDIPVAIRN